MVGDLNDDVIRQCQEVTGPSRIPTRAPSPKSSVQKPAAPEPEPEKQLTRTAIPCDARSIHSAGVP